MVLVIAGDGPFQVEPAVFYRLRQQMVQHFDAGFKFIFPGAIQI